MPRACLSAHPPGWSTCNGISPNSVRLMNDVLEVARELQVLCDSRGWKSCVIGGIAVMRWGEPRVTRDVDLTLLVGFGREDSFIRTLLAAYTARIPDADSFARRHRVLLLQ